MMVHHAPSIRTLAASAFALAAFGVSDVAHATRLEVDKQIVEVMAAAGKHTATTITFTNKDRNPVTLRASFVDPDADGWVTKAQPIGTYPLTAGMWTAATPENAVIGPGESLTLQIALTPPAEATGGYHVILSALFKPWKPLSSLSFDPDREAAGRMELDTMFSIPIYVAIADRFEEVVSIRAFAPVPGDGGLPSAFTLTLSNDGDVHFLGVARLTVVNENGDVVFRDAPDTPGRMLPGQWGALQVAAPPSLPPGAYTALVSFQTRTGRTATAEIRF